MRNGKVGRAARPAGGSDRTIFDRSAAPLIEQDISGLRPMIAGWQARGIEDLRAYLGRHLSVLRRAIHSIKVIDVNAATVKLYEAREKRQLLGPLDVTIDPEAVTSRIELIAAVAEGREELETESTALTLGGRRIELLMKTSIPARGDANPRLLVTITDITERKRLERRIRQERGLLLSLINNSPDLFFYKDSEGRFILVNRTFADLSGLRDPSDAVGKTDFDIYRRELAEKYRSDDQRVMDSCQPSEAIEERFVSPDGMARWMETRKVPITDAADRVVGLLGTSRDITERKKAEEALEASRAYAEDLIRTANIMVVGLDTRLKVNEFNEMAQRITGYTREEIANRFLFEVLTPEEKYPEVWERMRTLMKTGLPEVFEAPLLTKNGEERFIVWHNGQIRREGIVIGSIGFGLDITERVRIEEKNIRLATLVESSHDAIIGIDRNDLVTSWNKGAEAIYGYTAAEMIGRPIFTLIPPEIEERARADRERILNGEDISHFETEQFHKDGRRLSVSLTLSPIRDSRGNIAGAAWISSDITSQKALQAQLIRAQRLESLATLAAGIAHQFNNINTAIKGYLEILSLGRELPAESRSYVQNALRSLDRAISITERLQGLTSSAPAALEDVDLAELVRSLLPLFERRFEENGTTVKTDLQPAARARANRALLSFVTESLFTNSLHALMGRPTRRISVRTRMEGGFACLEVSDTGCGISAENLPRIFTPFFTTKGEWAATGSTQFRVKGVGLSLAVSQSGLAEIGGRIEVESIPDQGSTFRVRLPAAPSPE